jgi:hypothetical protein
MVILGVPSPSICAPILGAATGQIDDFRLALRAKLITVVPLQGGHHDKISVAARQRRTGMMTAFQFSTIGFCMQRPSRRSICAPIFASHL